MTKPTPEDRPLEMRLSWSAGIEYVQDYLALVGNVSVTNMLCNPQEPVQLRDDCDANVTLSVYSVTQNGKRLSQQPISLYGFTVFSIIVLSLCVLFMVIIIGWNIFAGQLKFSVVEL